MVKAYSTVDPSTLKSIIPGTRILALRGTAVLQNSHLADLDATLCLRAMEAAMGNDGNIDETYLALTANKAQKWLGILWGLIAIHSSDYQDPGDLAYVQTTKHPVSVLGAAPHSPPYHLDLHIGDLSESRLLPFAAAGLR